MRLVYHTREVVHAEPDTEDARCRRHSGARSIQGRDDRGDIRDRAVGDPEAPGGRLDARQGGVHRVDEGLGEHGKVPRADEGRRVHGSERGRRPMEGDGFVSACRQARQRGEDLREMGADCAGDISANANDRDGQEEGGPIRNRDGFAGFEVGRRMSRHFSICLSETDGQFWQESQRFGVFQESFDVWGEAGGHRVSNVWKLNRKRWDI